MTRLEKTGHNPVSKPYTVVIKIVHYNVCLKNPMLITKVFSYTQMGNLKDKKYKNAFYFCISCIIFGESAAKLSESFKPLFTFFAKSLY